MAGCRPWDHKRVGHNLATKQQQLSEAARKAQDGSRPQALGSSGGWIKTLRVGEQWEAVSAEAGVWGEVG